MTNQEAFNIVYTHLLQQGEKSFGHDMSGYAACVYRGKNNTKCAIGALIPDELYVRSMEGKTIINLLNKKDLKLNEHFLNVSSSLLSDLQDVHDLYDVHNWAHNLTVVAKEWQLTIPE